MDPHILQGIRHETVLYSPKDVTLNENGGGLVINGGPVPFQRHVQSHRKKFFDRGNQITRIKKRKIVFRFIRENV